MIYRKAVKADTLAIAELHAESWRNTFTFALSEDYRAGPVYAERRAVWEQRMSSPAGNQYVLLAEEGDHLAGFACAYGDDDEELGTLLDNLHVRPAWQGTGVADILVAMVAKWSVQQHSECGMYLLVLEQNTRARRFYERLGAYDAGAADWHPPGGGYALSRRYAWTAGQLRELIAAQS